VRYPVIFWIVQALNYQREAKELMGSDTKLLFGDGLKVRDTFVQEKLNDSNIVLSKTYVSFSFSLSFSFSFFFFFFSFFRS